MDDVEEEAHLSVRELFEKRQETHLALGESHAPGVDTWKPLWDWVFADDVYQSWQRNDSKWMLRCVGGPGSGKTTLSSLLVERLRRKHDGDGDAVAAVFVRTDVASGGSTAFVEDFLASVFRQLCVRHAKIYEDEDDDAAHIEKYREYFEARNTGLRDARRIQLLRDALQLCLGILDRAFLVVDDFDRCSPAADLILESELAALALLGLKVFLTSRVPCLATVPLAQACDSCQDERLRATFRAVYWRCEECRRRRVKLAHILCQDCRDAGKTCANCGESADFVQPFDHVELKVDLNRKSVGRFIDWDLEAEHGDLGLGSSDDGKPPKSAFGRKLSDPRNHEALSTLQEQLRYHAQGNVSLARLRLDNVHRTQSVDKITSAWADTLPANIVAFFDAGIRRIEDQPPARRDLGLKAIAAVAHYHYSDGGLEYAALDRILRRASARGHATRTQSAPVVSTTIKENKNMSTAVDAVHVPHRSLEEMLHAVCGFLTIGVLGHRPLQAYCESFHTYARENYNESLVWAHAQLDFGGEDDEGGLAEFGSNKVRRSLTGVADLRKKKDQAATQRPFLSLLQERREQGRKFVVGGGGGGLPGIGPGRGRSGAGAVDGPGDGGRVARYPSGPARDADGNDATGARGEMPKDRLATETSGKPADAARPGRDPSFRMLRNPTWA
ncbi:TOL protein [Colletotrichum sojae]|uniref:TOL protein n=1 Tax=Colletotrichum sojae TaxID=2175907 RepID=A0A8H6MN16_9PEZI|nr:TOL protein [Colletotrichum sojae]